MNNNSRDNLADKIQDNSLDLWFNLKLNKIKEASPNDNKKELINKCLVGIDDYIKLEYLLSKGADLKSKEGLVLIKRYVGNRYTPQSEKMQNKLIGILKEDFINQIKPADTSYKKLHQILSTDTIFAKKIARLDINWAKKQYFSSDSNDTHPFESPMPFLYYIAKNGPLSAKAFLSSPSCFANFTKEEKQDYILNLSFYVYENTFFAMSYGKKMSKKANLSLLNYLTNKMDKETKDKFMAYCFKHGIHQDLNVDTSMDKNIWSSKSLLPAVKPQPTLKKIINKKNKTVSDIEFLKSKGFDFSSNEAKVFLKNAIMQSNLAVCKKLIDEKVDINHTFPMKTSLNYNFTDNFGVKRSVLDKMSVLDMACAYSTPNIVKYFLSKGLNVDGVENKFFIPPLFHAISKGSLENAKALLSKGANINALDADGRNALWYLPGPTGIEIDNKPVQIASFLIKSNIDTFHTANNGDAFVKGYEQRLKNTPLFALYPNKFDYVLSSLKDTITLTSSYVLKESISSTSNNSPKKKKRML